MPATSPAVSNLIEQLGLARAESDRFFEIIRSGSLYERPIDARHRIIFYIGHLDGFDSIQICREGLGVKSFNPEFDDLFQAGIDPDSGHLPADQPSDWPSLERVREYVTQSRAHVDRYLESAPEEVVYMSLEHRHMHLETLAYMFHNLPYGMKNAPHSGASLSSAGQRANEWKAIPAGTATLGKPHDEFFGWDNEFNQTRYEVPGFDIQRFPVTNGEYVEFVKQGAAIPHFWRERDGKFFLRGMFAEIPLPLSWPVYVTQAQARAYAEAHGKAVATEQQFHRAAYGSNNGINREYPWGNQAPLPMHGNFNFQNWDPVAVDSNPAGESAFGVSQLVGNGWEWTSTAFGPLPGFKPRPSYPGYSANFFDGKHYVLKGGSARTSERLLRASFRNWFRDDYPFVYAKFRCVSR